MVENTRVDGMFRVWHNDKMNPMPAAGCLLLGTSRNP